jgi:DNA processing protein
MEGKYLLVLAQFLKFGSVRIKKIAKYFNDDFESAFFSNTENFLKAGIDRTITEEFIEFRKKLDLDKILDDLNKENVNFLFYSDNNYPKLLLEIHDPPPVLYYKGEILSNNQLSLGVVGARKNTFYGEKITKNLVEGLVENNFIIVSGMALGIDSLAHKTALNNNGRTFAVLASGLDRKMIYPSSNLRLFDDIIENNGIIFSEFPLNTQSFKFNFPRRNRIISGLSNGVLLIEAGEKSGSLITAYCALEQNREVFAVPGNIDSNFSQGTNNLIKKGAKLVSNIDDILDSFGFENKNEKQKNNVKKIHFENQEEEKIWSFVKNGQININELKNLTKIDISIINATLIIMEIKGYVKNLGGGNYLPLF